MDTTQQQIQLESRNKLPWLPLRSGYLVCGRSDSTPHDRILATFPEAQAHADALRRIGGSPRTYYVMPARDWGRIDAAINWLRRLLVPPRVSLRNGDGLYDCMAISIDSSTTHMPRATCDVRRDSSVAHVTKLNTQAHATH